MAIQKKHFTFVETKQALMKNIFFSILIITVIFAVIFFIPKQSNQSKDYILLQKAEAIMHEKPDSALSLLKNISYPEILEGETQALYALLFTQAQYKNYIPVKTDSLIQIAEKYYSTNADSIHKAWTYFYAAQVYWDMNKPEKALRYFQKADRASQYTDNYIFLKLLYSHWGYLLLKQELFDESLIKLDKSMYYAKTIHDMSSIILILENISWNYVRKQDYKQAEVTTLQALDLARKIKDKDCEVRLLQRLSVIFQMEKQPQKALQYINKSLELNKSKDFLDFYPSWITKGDIFMDLQQYDSARYYFAKDTRYNTLNEKAGHHQIWAEYEEKVGNYQEAMNHWKKYNTFLDSIYETNIATEMMELQKKYDYSTVKNENSRLKIKQQHLYIWILCICIIVLIVGGILYYYYNKDKRIKEEIIHSKDDFLKQMRLQLQEKNIALQETREEITLKELELAKELSQKEEVLKLYSSNEQQMRKEILRTSEIIRKIEALNDMNQKDKISSAVILSDQDLENLIETVNICYNNFADRLHQQFPALTEADINLCCFMKMGIPISNIICLLDTSKMALKKRRNRMKHDKMNMDEDASLEDFIQNF